MSFNYFIEKKKFDEKWEKLAYTYENAGMDKEAIRQMYLFDLEEFNSKRKAERRKINAPMSEEDEFLDVAWLMKTFPRAELSSEYDALATHSRYWWLEEISSPLLTPRIKGLKEEERELLTMYIYEQRTEEEIAIALGVHHTTVSRRLAKLFKSFIGKRKK